MDKFLDYGVELNNMWVGSRMLLEDGWMGRSEEFHNAWFGHLTDHVSKYEFQVRGIPVLFVQFSFKMVFLAQLGGPHLQVYHCLLEHGRTHSINTLAGSRVLRTTTLSRFICSDRCLKYSLIEIV